MHAVSIHLLHLMPAPVEISTANKS